jgi:hypothetical protein
MSENNIFDTVKKIMAVAKPGRFPKPSWFKEELSD